MYFLILHSNTVKASLDSNNDQLIVYCESRYSVLIHKTFPWGPILLYLSPPQKWHMNKSIVLDTPLLCFLGGNKPTRHTTALLDVVIFRKEPIYRCGSHFEHEYNPASLGQGELGICFEPLVIVSRMNQTALLDHQRQKRKISNGDPHNWTMFQSGILTLITIKGTNPISMIFNAWVYQGYVRESN